MGDIFILIEAPLYLGLEFQRVVKIFLGFMDYCEKKKKRYLVKKQFYLWAVVVAQLVEQSLLTPEVHGLNPVIGEIKLSIVYCQLY